MNQNTPQSNGRDQNGRFAPGNTIGRRGRPRREIETAYLQSFVDGCPDTLLEQIVAKLCQQALAGQIQASKLLLQHAMPDRQLRIELASNDESYRVAGQTPEAGLAEMLDRINKKVLAARAEKEEK